MCAKLAILALCVACLSGCATLCSGMTGGAYLNCRAFGGPVDMELQYTPAPNTWHAVESKH